MPGESARKSPQSIWQSQKGEGVRMPVDDIRRKAKKFRNKWHRR